MKKLLLIIVGLTVALIISIQPTYAFTNDFDSTTYQDKKIVFLGDSITSANDITFQADRYTNIVADTLGFDSMVNMGVSDTTIAERVGFTNSFLERASSIPVDADYVFIYGGVNDFRHDVPIADFTADFDTLISTIETNIPTAEIVVLTPYKSVGHTTPNGVGAVLEDYVDVIVAATDQTADITPQVNIVNLFEILGIEGNSDYNITDSVHLNVLGHRRLANLLISYMAGENLISPTDYVNEGWVSGSTFVETIDDYHSTSYIKVKADYTYAYTAYGKSSLGPIGSPGSFYDKDYNYISKIPADLDNIYKIFTVPTNAEYVILNVAVEFKEDVFLHEIVNYDLYTVDFENANVSESIIEDGFALEKPDDPIKPGYTFDGWYLDENLTTEYDFTSLVTDNMTLYAKWIPIDGTGNSIIDNSTGNLSIFGIEWYWLAAIGAGAYLLLGTKKGRKAIGLK